MKSRQMVWAWGNSSRAVARVGPYLDPTTRLFRCISGGCRCGIGRSLAFIGEGAVELGPFERADVLLYLHFVNLEEVDDFLAVVGKHGGFAREHHAVVDDLLLI